MDPKLVGYITNLLRFGQSRRKWYVINEAEKRFRVQVGHYKNEKPKYGTICSRCHKTDKSASRIWRLDHIAPVRGIRGFTGFDDMVVRMHPDKYGYSNVCTDCHDLKTAEETDYRTRYRKLKSKEEKDALEKEFNQRWEDLREKLKKEFP